MSRAVIVLGFHRSGTSMTTRLLGLMGVDLGPETDMLPASDVDNPRGYWEPRWVVETDDTLLAALGGRYHAPPALPRGWHERPELDPVREYARARLARFDGVAVWGVKDPRLCLTLPFWQALLAERGDEPAYVLCVRSPLEVAASMGRRGIYPGMDVAAWGELWLRYTRAALAATEGAPRIVVTYDDLLRDGAGEAVRIARRLGLPAPGPELEIDAGLRHHATSPDDVARDARLSPAVRAAYAELIAGPVAA
jgi:hypothetical protein